jgi:hypothetical protein
MYQWNVPSCVEVPRCRMNLRYTSNSRAKYVCEEQMKIMKELNVPVLDIFEATYLSGDQHPARDAVHYQRAFNKLISGYFYKSENQTL